MTDDKGERSAAETRRNSFVLHLVAYFIATCGGLFIYVTLMPQATWIVALLGIWGIGVAFHCAKAMGLLGGGKKEE